MSPEPHGHLPGLPGEERPRVRHVEPPVALPDGLDGAVLPARRTLALHTIAYAVSGVAALLVGALAGEPKLARLLGVGLVSPILISLFLIALHRPSRRLQGPLVRPASTTIAPDAEAVRQARMIVGAMALVGVFLGVAFGTDR